MSICTYHTAKEGLKQFEDLKVRFETEYHMKEEKVSDTARLFTLVTSTGSTKITYYSVLKSLIIFFFYYLFLIVSRWSLVHYISK